jgi:hypothetical protein
MLINNAFFGLRISFLRKHIIVKTKKRQIGKENNIEEEEELEQNYPYNIIVQLMLSEE